MIEINLSTLRIGSEGSQVGVIQILLNAYGYRDGDGELLDIDNDFGVLTDSAIREFQRDNGLDDDGIVGVNTWNALLK